MTRSKCLAQRDTCAAKCLAGQLCIKWLARDSSKLTWSDLSQYDLSRVPRTRQLAQRDLLRATSAEPAQSIS